MPPDREEDVWSSLLEPGLILVSGTPRTLRGAFQEVAHEVLARGRHVLWCDGDHGFDPYDFAELNLTRGLEADEGADRLLVKRCMTPFQWDTVLTQHLGQKLTEVDAGAALALPFDRQYSTDELSDWEAEDYVRYAVRHLRNLSRRHRIAITLGVDMQRWWTTHPVLAQMTYDAADARWTLAHRAGTWRLARQGGSTLESGGRGVTLKDFLPQEESPAPLTVASPRRRVAPVAGGRPSAGPA